MPLRRCIACGEQRPKREMLRLVRTPGGHVDVDAEPKAAGRGAYVCRTRECLSRAAQGTQVRRALQLPLPEEAAACLEEMARQASMADRDAGR